MKDVLYIVIIASLFIGYLTYESEEDRANRIAVMEEERKNKEEYEWARKVEEGKKWNEAWIEQSKREEDGLYWILDDSPLVGKVNSFLINKRICSAKDFSDQGWGWGRSTEFWREKRMKVYFTYCGGDRIEDKVLWQPELDMVWVRTPNGRNKDAMGHRANMWTIKR